MALLKIAIALLLLQTPATTPERAVPSASIEGIVTGASGDPLSKATVTVSGVQEPLSSQGGLPPGGIIIVSNTSQIQASGLAIPQEFTATTTRDGKFIFENLKPGSYFLHGQHPGYLSNEYGQRGPNGLGTPIALTAGQKLKGIQLTLTPQGAITGRIVDRNGQPLSGALVQAIQYSYQEWGRTLNVVQAVTSNDMGEYRLYWLAPGPYIVCVSPGENLPSMDPAQLGLSGNSPANLTLLRTLMSMGRTSATVVNGRTLTDGSTVEESQIAVFYPGVYSAQDSATVTVRAGMTAGGVNITATPARAQRIRGITINGTTGLPEAMQLSLAPRNSSNITGIASNIRSADNGKFEIAGIVPGSYYLIANADTSKAVLPMDIANSDVNNIVLTTTVGITISGRLTIEGGGTLPTQIRLASTNTSLPSAGAVLEANNRFQVPGVIPGDYFVTLLGNGDRYLKSVRLGGQDGLADPIHIDEQTRNEFDIVLSRSSGKLDGRVLNERRESVSNATIVVIPDPPLRRRTSMYYTPRADSSGRFQIEAAPGRYQVFAWDDIEPNAWFDADFMRAFEGRGRSVVISENGRESVEVTVISRTP